MTTPSTFTQTVTPIDLKVTGMTCASCAARVEKKLNKVPGVVATVNYATETAHVEAPTGVSVDDLVAVVEATGYGVAEPEAVVDDDPDELGRRWRVSAVLTVPLVPDAAAQSRRPSLSKSPAATQRGATGELCVAASVNVPRPPAGFTWKR